MSPPQKIILISGANQGIGLELCNQISKRPNFHILLGSRDLSKGTAAASSLHTTRVSAIQLDITDDSSISLAVATVEAKFGRLDILVNNAGIMSDRPTGPNSIKDGGGSNIRAVMREAFEVNVISSTQMTESFLPLIFKSTDPRIIFMSSGLGSLHMTLDPGDPYYGYFAPAYKSSKAAINMVMACYAVKLREKGVKVNACCPGAVSTGMNNFREGLGTVEEGTINAVRLVTEEDGETGTFTGREGTRPW